MQSLNYFPLYPILGFIFHSCDNKLCKLCSAVLLSAEALLAGVGEIEEAVAVLVLLVQLPHRHQLRGDRVAADQQEKLLVRRHLQALLQHSDELHHVHTVGDQPLHLEGNM